MADKKMLSEFARRAAQRIKDRKVSIKFKIELPRLGEEIEFRTLLDDELMEIYDSGEKEDKRGKDKMCVYTAAVSPNLRELATELMEAGEITEYMQVLEMYNLAEQTKMTHLIMEKSGFMMDENDAPRLVETATANAKN